MYKIYNVFTVECYAVVLLYLTYKMYGFVVHITCLDILSNL